VEQKNVPEPGTVPASNPSTLLSMLMPGLTLVEMGASFPGASS